MLNTLRFEIVIGLMKGYKNLVPNYKDEDNIAAKLWQENALKEYNKNKIYVSAVVKRSYTVYSISKGCPIGGERTVVITGVADKNYINKLQLWKDTVLNLALKLKNQLEQEYITCEFIKTELYEL